MTHAMTHGMTCTECLSLVATADVTELTTADMITEHCRTCADCANVIAAVADEATRLGDMLDGTLPGVPAHVVALRAVAGAAAGRRRAGQLLHTALGTVAVLAALLMVFVLLRLFPADAGSMEVRNVALHCLAPEQVLALARPQLPPRVTVSVGPAPRAPVLTLRGPRADLATAERLIARLDARWGAEWSSYCTAPSNLPRP